jgi:hypothetical protein
MWLTSKDIGGLFWVAGSIVVTVAALAFTLGYLTGCTGVFGATGVHHTPGTIKGYCFESEGLRGERCYESMPDCLSHESVLRDQYPWARIEKECELEMY